MSGCPLSDVAMSSPSLHCILNADQVEPPTPTDSTSSKAPLDGDRIPYDELLSKYVDLQSSSASLQSNVERLELQNNYWTKLYTYVEQGLTLKITELNTLREENQQLKERNLHLTAQLEEALAISQNSQIPPNVAKWIQQLQDQVRARDLVIDLMKKAEQERLEKEMQEKLDMQRQQLQRQITLANGLAMANQIAPTGGERRCPPTRSQSAKSLRKPPSRRQSNPKARRQKFQESPAPSSLKENDPRPSGSEGAVNKEKNESVDTESSKAAEIDEEMQLEKEFNEALEELNNEFSNEALEGLFNEVL